MPSPHGVVMPPLRTMLASIGLQVVEGTLVPALIFWAMLHLTGLVWALFAGLAWCYLAIAGRWARGVALPAVLVVGALLFTTRTGVALAFHSTFVYLLTPTINAFVLAAAFAGSVLLRRPLTERFARDFVGLPAHVTALVRVQRVLRRLSLVWAMVNIVNGTVALQLLVADHYDAVLLARSVLAPVLSAMAVACCVIMGRRALRDEGIHLHLRWRDEPPAASAS
ncbi:MAG: Intracellular septation protein [Frankiales bacterium]|nr:Intracellular septation protein [Frankiales bacterium]